ncbi:MAG: aldo/keto reductase [Candidatus Omnitrophica bacterium]|nr:aldo/keto reductase [Candidatus Omnitrophota bacterium]
MAIAGFATPAGTRRYRTRQAECHPTHFRDLQGLTASSIGCGTYLGDPDDATDQLYTEALEHALGRGVNFLDTASNYRCQRSERAVGQTLERLSRQGRLARDEVIVCTKGGYLPYDGEPPADPGRYIVETFLRPGLLRYDDLVAGCHCLAPRYLEHQLTISLKNLRVETVDIYYLHNPEQQLDEIPRETFLSRMEACFRFLESQAAAGRIRLYGTATWNGYRLNSQHHGYLSLQELAGLARRVGGEHHHFRVVQLPFNLSMPEAYAFKNQSVDGQMLSVGEAAARLGMSVVTSAALLQSQLTTLPQPMQQWIPGCQTDAQRAIQFARSTPGITTALTGMKRTAHVEDNLMLARLPTLTADAIERLFARPDAAPAPQ